MDPLHLHTIAVTAGRPATVPDAPLNHPITPAATYVGGGARGYGRYGNPVWEALEEVIGGLEGGQAVAFSSGMAAATALLDLVPQGGTVLIADTCYLGVATLVAQRVDAGRLTAVPVPVSDTTAILQAARGADLVWLESPTNPLMDLADLSAVADGLRALGADRPRLVVDNTFATPILQRPLDLGADLVLHSATKFFSGHSDALLGTVVSNDEEVLGQTRSTRTLQGAVPGALECYLVLRGLRTLPLRVLAAQDRARTLAGRLAAHPSVHRVRYPGFGSVLSIELSDADTADAVVAAVQLWVPATSLGGVESTLERRRRWPNELPAVPPGLLRLSVGIEHIEDLWADLAQALQ